MTPINLNFSLLDELNIVKQNKYGVVSAILAIDKPSGVTSHDIVDEVRKKLGTRKVGHGGTLDPFATGVLVVLVGKKYTKQAEKLLALDKAYKMRVLLGVQTDTLDTEGKVIQKENNYIFSSDSKRLEEIVNVFEGGYLQNVPLYSSVKVNGMKLRILARSSESFETYKKEGKLFAKFYNFNGKDIQIEIPSKQVEISDIEIVGTGTIEGVDLADKLGDSEKITSKDRFPFIDIHFSCSKGTYARQFAADFAEKLETIGMLIELQRTRVANISVSDCIKVDDVMLP